jgi:DUF4097 and DUF4098 domain-containing protein YvlB
MRVEKKMAIIVASMLLITGLVMAAASFRAAAGDIKESVIHNQYEAVTKDITENFENIDIELGDQNLEIKKSDNNKSYLICGENDNVKFNVSVSGKTLKIEEKFDSRVMNLEGLFSINDFTSQLYLPEDEYQNLKVHIGSGDIKMEDAFTFRDVNVAMGSGDGYIFKVKADEINAKLGSGQFWLAESRCKSANITVGSGDISVENFECSRDFFAKSSSGKLFLTDVIASASMEASTGSGDIFLKRCDSLGMNFRTGSGDITGSVKTAKSFDAKAGSGDVNVPGDGNGGNCVIRTGSGDIDIVVEN